MLFGDLAAEGPFVPFRHCPSDWPVSVVPLRTGLAYFPGDVVVTAAGARPIAAFLCSPVDRFEQPWAILTAPAAGASSPTGGAHA